MLTASALHKKSLRLLLADFSDLDRIQTCNLLSRNQMRYSIAPRGRVFRFANIAIF